MIDIDCRIRLGDRLIAPILRSGGQGVTALFGPSGCGKTTTLNLIAGLLKPFQGHIRIGDDILFDSARGIDVPVEQRRAGYVFQQARLFPHMSVRANLHYGAQRAPAGAPAVDEDALIALLGLETLLERRPASLSGGEAQRVALGRALMARPRLLLLDEPLSALDRARRNEIIPYLQALRRSWPRPIVLVSHDAGDVLRLADWLVLMDDGQVNACGPVDEVAASPDGFGDLGPLTLAPATVARIDAGGVSVIAAAHSLVVAGGPGDDAALRPGTTMRLIIAADDVVLATGPLPGVSITNQLPGTLTAIVPQPGGLALARIDCNGLPLMARVTAASLERLGLTPGSHVHALIKAARLLGYPQSD